MNALASIGIGTVFNERFELTGFVGHGGMAVVWAAVDLRYDRRAAAVKLMGREVAASAQFRARFAREARLAADVAHPHILPIWDAGIDRGVFYIATPLADSDLSTMIDDVGRLPLREAVAVL